MRGVMLAGTIAALVAMSATSAFAQQPKTGPAHTTRFFTTPLEKDPSREVKMQMQLHEPGPGNPYHTHDGDQWEVVLDGEITFMVRGQEPRVLKAGEWVYIPRGTVHRNENRSGKQTRTIELVIADKGRPPVTPASAQ